MATVASWIPTLRPWPDWRELYLINFKTLYLITGDFT